MYYRLMKCALTVAYLFLIVLTWKFFRGQLDWGLSLGCVLVSGFWLVLTRLQMRHLFRTYFDVLSRMQVFFPLSMGLILSAVAIFATSSLLLWAAAVLEFLFWGYIYILYRRNRRKYITQGHGPLPAGSWVNPPAEALQAGDLILTSGRIANTFQESVGHGEVVIQLADGTLAAFSSYMAQGVVVNDLRWLSSRWLARGEHWVVMRLDKPLSPQQIAQATALAEQMRSQNDAWRSRVNLRRQRIIGWLPLPASWKNWLFDKTKATGYDWLGLFFGNLAGNRWTCIGACLELYQRLGIKTNRYGTGLFGLGTGFLDPIMPVRFLNDRSFRLLTHTDKEAVGALEATN